jgi:hypothetical protein
LFLVTPGRGRKECTLAIHIRVKFGRMLYDCLCFATYVSWGGVIERFRFRMMVSGISIVANVLSVCMRMKPRREEISLEKGIRE